MPKETATYVIVPALLDEEQKNQICVIFDQAARTESGEGSFLTILSEQGRLETPEMADQYSSEHVMNAPLSWIMPINPDKVYKLKVSFSAEQTQNLKNAGARVQSAAPTGYRVSRRFP